MKRAYVAIIGEYYDTRDIEEEASSLGIRRADLTKIFRVKDSRKKKGGFEF